jgi:hypothetical protein
MHSHDKQPPIIYGTPSIQGSSPTTIQETLPFSRERGYGAGEVVYGTPGVQSQQPQPHQYLHDTIPYNVLQQLTEMVQDIAREVKQLRIELEQRKTTTDSHPSQQCNTQTITQGSSPTLEETPPCCRQRGLQGNEADLERQETYTENAQVTEYDDEEMGEIQNAIAQVTYAPVTSGATKKSGTVTPCAYNLLRTCNRGAQCPYPHCMQDVLVLMSIITANVNHQSPDKPATEPQLPKQEGTQQAQPEALSTKPTHLACKQVPLGEPQRTNQDSQHQSASHGAPRLPPWLALEPRITDPWLPPESALEPYIIDPWLPPPTVSVNC